MDRDEFDTLGILNSSDSEYIKKCEEYNMYINKHVRLVKSAYERLFVNRDISITISEIPSDVVEDAITKASIAVARHDSSKYSDDEFYAYRMYFYPTEKEKSAMEVEDQYKMIKEQYDVAWQHHYMLNPHHPEYWMWHDSKLNLLSERLQIPTDMRLVYIIEMICDWDSMSKIHNNSVLDFYNSDRSKDEREAMSPRTKRIVEELLNQLYNK